MVYTVSDNELFSLICLQYGVPTLLFLAINIICLQQFNYRMWRLQIWLHRLTVRFRTAAQIVTSIGGLTVDPEGFDTRNHWHDLEQDYPLVRLGVAPVMAFGVVMLMLMPFLSLLAWGVIMWIVVDKMLAGIAIVLMGVCIISLYYAIQYWHSGGWRMTSHIQFLFGFSLGSYFFMAFCLSFLGDDVSFFGQSVHFLTLNYILLTELLSQVEKQAQLPAETLLKADEIAGGDTGGADLGGGGRLSDEEKHARQKEQEKKFFEKFKAEHAILPASDASTVGGGGGTFESADSDEDLPDDEAEERLLAEEAKGATLVDIQASKVEIKFKDVLHTLIHEAHQTHSQAEVKYQIKIYFLSLGVLLGYSFAIYYGNAPENPADSTSDSSEYLGFIVSGILVLWDALMYVYATYSGKVMDEATKILVLAGSRVALIAFGFQGWFLGVVCLYVAAGVYLSYRIIDRRMPYAAFQLNLEAKQCQRFKEFAVHLTNPDDQTTNTASSNALISTMTSGESSIGIAEFVLIILTVLYFMAFCVTYQVSPPTQSLGDSIEPWQQWEIGLLGWFIVVAFAMSVWTIRYWMIHNWKITWQAALLTTITQAIFTIGAILIFLRAESVIALVWLICGPIFVIALIGTYMHCVKVDWHVLAPAYMRNPPNLPFPLALISCGLQKDDYRMLINIVLTVTMMCIIGLAITLGLDGSSIGWSITFILFILVTSIIPLVKYLQTLTFDRVDSVLLFLWFCAHMTFFGLLYNTTDDLSDKDAFALWGSCIGYPTILLNILGYKLFQQNGNKMNKNTARIFLITFILIVICVILTFFLLGAAVGGMILGSIVIALFMTLLFARWVNGRYTLPRYLRILSFLSFTGIMVAGVVLGVTLPAEEDGFWLYSASWFLLILYVAIIAWGDKARLNQGDAQSTGNTFRYSSYIFPVYYYDRRNEVNPVRPANLHMALYCLAFGLGFVWCAACMVTSRINIGLGLSSLCMIGFFTFLRNRSISSNKNLMRILPYISDGVVHRSKESARTSQLSGTGILFEDPQPNIFGLKRWGALIHGMMMFHLDPLPALKKKQAGLKRKLGLGRSCFCSRLNTDPHELDDHFILLEKLNDWSFACAKIMFKIEAHFYFLLLLNAMSDVQSEESSMKSFCSWLRKEKVHPVTGQPVQLDPYISNHEMYSSPRTRFTQSYIMLLQKWKLEYVESLRATQASNEENRQKEMDAERVRNERLEKREAERAAKAKAKEEEMKAIGSQPVSGFASSHASLDPVEQEFRRAIDVYKTTGKKFVDDEFPPTPDSLYLLGERTPSKGSALNQLPIDDEWRRPEEILKLLKEENPTENIDTRPRVFIDGFDLTDIVQGNIGTTHTHTRTHNKKHTQHEYLRSLGAC